MPVFYRKERCLKVSDEYGLVVKRLSSIESKRSSDIGDGRVFYFVKIRHACGHSTEWFIVLRELEKKAENYGAWCNHCHFVAKIPLVYLAVLVAGEDTDKGRVILALIEMERIAEAAERSEGLTEYNLQRRLREIGLS